MNKHCIINHVFCVQIQNNWTYGETMDEIGKTHPMLRPYKTFSEKVLMHALLSVIFTQRHMYIFCGMQYGWLGSNTGVRRLNVNDWLICVSFVCHVTCVMSKPSVFAHQDKEIYRWPIKESIKAMLAWEWTIEKARDEGEKVEKAATRKISQTAQVTNLIKQIMRNQNSFKKTEPGVFVHPCRLLMIQVRDIRPSLWI